MFPRRFLVLGIALALGQSATAQESKSPLRFVPDVADLVIQAERPRELVDMVLTHELFIKAQELPGYRELYDSTNAQRLLQLIAYLEKKLDQPRRNIFDDLTVGGIVFAAKLTEPKGAMLAIQARSDQALRRLADVAVDLLATELERQESKDRIERAKYLECDTFKIGKDLAFALADGTLLIANNETTLKYILDHRKDGKSILTVASFTEARKQAPPKALAWGWLGLEELRKQKGFMAGLEAASLDPNQIILIGGLTNLLKRSPYLSGSLVRDDRDVRLTLTMPRGRDGMGALANLLLPTDDRGTFTPLHPPRTLASSAYYLDLGQFWEKRRELLGEKNAKGLEEGEKNITKVLGKLKLSRLLHAAGPHQRLVFAQQKDRPYKIKPATPFPAFALVVDMRDPSFATDMNTIFRSAALLATFQFGLALKEDTYKDCDLISYHFSETKKVPGDPDGIRFNFTPTYVTVDDSFVISATSELARDLIDQLKAEKKGVASPATTRTRLFASGINDLIRGNEDAALTKLILTQAVPPKTARKELAAVMDWIDRLGQVQLETRYGEHEFRYDIIWRPRQ